MIVWSFTAVVAVAFNFAVAFVAAAVVVAIGVEFTVVVIEVVALGVVPVVV